MLTSNKDAPISAWWCSLSLMLVREGQEHSCKGSTRDVRGSILVAGKAKHQTKGHWQVCCGRILYREEALTYLRGPAWCALLAPSRFTLHSCRSPSPHLRAYLNLCTAGTQPYTSSRSHPEYIVSMDASPGAEFRTPSADDIFRNSSGAALESEGLTWKSLLAGVAYALILFSAQTLLFLLIRPRFPRI